jgi:Na+-transporting methylmalonyl-CoA/oxaloacetate decarboxylase gamma subunit
MVLPFLVLLAYKILFLSTLKQGMGKNYRKNHKEKKKIQKNQQNT